MQVAKMVGGWCAVLAFMMAAPADLTERTPSSGSSGRKAVALPQRWYVID